MSGSGVEGLDVIIVDDDDQVCRVLQKMLETFYTWGEIHAFNDFLQAKTFCFNQDRSLGIFVLDVFMGEYTAFDFIEAVSLHYPMAAQDSVVVTGAASSDVVDMCMAMDVNYLLEKPIKTYTFQFAIRAIASKYLAFADMLRKDPMLAGKIELLSQFQHQ